MTSAMISQKYQVVIPKEVRENAHLKSGQRVTFLVKGRTIQLIPERSIESMKGMAKGLNISGYREKQDRPL